MGRIVVAWCLVAGISASAAADVKLERKYIPGTSSTSHTSHTATQTLTLAGMDIDTVSTRFVIVTQKVGERKEDGTLPVTGQIDKLQLDVKLPGGNSLQFDSGDPKKMSENADLERVLGLLRVIARTKWTVAFDKDNKVQSFEYADNPADMVDDMFKSQFDPAKRKQAAVKEQGILPDKPVKPGDTWTNTTEHDLGGGQMLVFQTRYEYLGTEEQGGKTLDKISTKATDVSYSLDPNAKSPFQLKESAMKIDSSDGTLLFDREKGAIVQAISKTAVLGTLTLTINGMDFPGKLDLKLDEKTTLQP